MPRCQLYQERRATYKLVCQRIHKLCLIASQLCLPTEELNGLLDFALLQIELRQGDDCRVALRVNTQGLVAAPLCSADILLHLEQRETFVYHWENIYGWRPDRYGRVS